MVMAMGMVMVITIITISICGDVMTGRRMVVQAEGEEHRKQQEQGERPARTSLSSRTLGMSRSCRAVL